MNKFFSISQFPSQFGKFFYNYFFEKYNLNSTYTPIQSNEIDFETKLLNLIHDNAQGISISMPFKKKVIPYLDKADVSVEKYHSCNTIKIQGNNTTGYNTDFKGLEKVSKYISRTDTISILGMGSIGNMFSIYLRGSVIDVFSRHLGNFDQRHKDNDVIINCTALGTSTTDSPLNHIPKSTHTVIDLSVKENNLKDLAKEKNVRYISGLEFYQYQFLEQFKIYTDIQLSDEEFNTALRVFNDNR